MIDLHMHSRYREDGEFTPAELVDQCCRQGITTMSITDHNCVQANAEARTQAKTKGIRHISGIEIDCVYKELNFHVLGYGIDEHSADFAHIELRGISNNRASLRHWSALRKHRRWAFMLRKTKCGNCPRTPIGKKAGRERCLGSCCWQSRSMQTICFVRFVPSQFA